MYVKKLKMNGVRGFDGRRKVLLDFARPDGSYAGWTVLAGRNGSGKTTLLRAIAICIIGQRLATQVEESLESWLSESQKSGSVTLDLVSDPNWDFGITEEYSGPVSAHWSYGRRKPTSRAFEEALRLRMVAQADSGEDFDVDSILSYSRTSFKAPESLDEILWSGQQFPGWFFAAYGPFRRLTDGNSENDRPQISAKEARSHRVPDYSEKLMAVRTLFSESESLSESVAWLINLHMRRLQARHESFDTPELDRVNGLMDVIFELLQDGLLPESYRVERVDLSGLWIRDLDSGQLMPLRQMSDGYRTVVALVLDIIRRMASCYPFIEDFSIVQQNGRPTLRQPGVVLIDEVDAHLHVSWQQRIGTWLKEHFPRVQFIVTTHSPYICQAADENGLIRLPGPKEASPPTVVSPDLYRRVVYGTGDDAVISELFGADTLYSSRAQGLRARLVSLETKVFSGAYSESELEELRQLKRRLSSSATTRVEEISARLIGENREGKD
ncbi:AAA family ATPase [Kitasatospora sp. NPDC088134]|uniref:AAA family ATPase n=1 Tax=Kitasatospora sp. NPDC088134 TaxID=3364071 RepID=UPI0037F39CC9